jgi:hypothetical protein
MFSLLLMVERKQTEDCVHYIFLKSNIKMSPWNTILEMQNSTASSTTKSTTYNCAAGVYCQLPLVNFASSPHKYYFLAAC